MRNLLLALVILGFPAGVVAQICSPPGESTGQSVAINRIGVETPYSLTAVIKTELSLANGNTISGSTTSHQAQDAQGRTRVETPNFCVLDNNGQPHWDGTILVNDPVANTQTSWHEGLISPRKIATRTGGFSYSVSRPLTLQQEYRNAWMRSQASNRAGNRTERIEVEHLGKSTIAGLEASGMRTTRTVPAGMQGNSLPLRYVEETWISDQYGMILRRIDDDPVLGKSTYEVTNFSPGEPDASLLLPPADYTLKVVP